MSDKARRGAPIVGQPNSGKRFSAAFQKFVNDLESLRKDHAGMQEYEKLCDDNSQLRLSVEQAGADLARKDRQLVELQHQTDQKGAEFQQRIESLERQKTEILEEFGKAYQVYHEKDCRLSEASLELTKATEAAKTAKRDLLEANNEKKYLYDELRIRKTQDEETQKILSALRVETRLKEAQLELAQNDLRTCRETLASLQKKVGLEPLEQSTRIQELDNLALKLHELVWRHLNKSISHIAALESTNSSRTRIPFVPSNSDSARALRCAVAESVICWQLSQRIFSSFTFSAEPHLNGLSGILDGLSKTHPIQARIIRCQVARISKEKTNINLVASSSAQEATTTLSGWFGDDNSQRRFVDDLGRLFVEALRLWQRLQCTGHQLRTSIDLADSNWSPEEYSRKRYDDIPLDHDRQQPGIWGIAPIAALFSNIYDDDDSKTKQPLFRRFALFADQSAVIVGTREHTMQRVTSANAGANRGRRGHDHETNAQDQTDQQGPNSRLLNATSSTGYHSDITSSSTRSQRYRKREVRGVV